MKKLATASALTGAALLTTTVVTTIGQPADGATRTITDRVGDATLGEHGQGDLSYVRVQYGPKRINIRLQWARGSYPGDAEEILLDTRPADPGPEVHITPAIDGGWDVLVRHWNKPGWKRTASGRAHYHLSVAAPYATLSIPRTAIRRKGHAQPARIRARAVDMMEGEGVVDRVPGGKRMSPWIHWK